MKQISPQELFKCIEELLACDAFELHITPSSDDGLDIYIPYMMNDALECYFFMTSVQMKGHYVKELSNKTAVELLETQTLPALIFRQDSNNVFTIWFKQCHQILNCYRYDQTGHFWRQGAEHWRRLVYIVGTIYDKYEYMGDTVCNKKELALLPLMEFAPFRMYSPINDSIDDYYYDTKSGITCIRELAREANDSFYLFLLRIYEIFPFSFVTRILGYFLNQPGRIKLYQNIYQKIIDASCSYSERSYPDHLAKQIQLERESADRTLKHHGFSGTYPLFNKNNTQIYAVEEHPFTILEAQDYSFRIQFMVSETKASRHPLHFGFFHKSGNTGRIEKNLHFLDS